MRSNSRRRRRARLSQQLHCTVEGATFRQDEEGAYFTRSARGRTFVATTDVPPDDLVPSMLATSDVFGTGWFAAEAANVKRARRSPSSATARLVCLRSSPRARWEPSASSA
jgi:hypothetical protein